MFSANYIMKEITSSLSCSDMKRLELVIESAGELFLKEASSCDDELWEEFVDALQEKLSKRENEEFLRVFVGHLVSAGGWRIMAKEDANFVSPLSLLMKSGNVWAFTVVFPNEAELAEYVRENMDSSIDLLAFFLEQSDKRYFPISTSLLDSGVSPQSLHPSSSQPLFSHALKSSSPEPISLLVSRGLNPFVSEDDEVCALMSAFSKGNVAAVKGILFACENIRLDVPEWVFALLDLGECREYALV